MKVLGIAVLAIVAGYGGGLLFDASAHANDSKLISLAETGEFGPNWIPFGLADKIVESQNYLETFPFGGGPYLFLQNAYLSDEEVFDHALIDFTISVDVKPDGTFINRVTECIFETDVDVNTECVVCIFRDRLGVNIAKGEQFFEPPYTANTPLVLEMNQFLHDDQYITDVRNVHGVQIGICMEQNGGCTPGFWKQPQHFDSWNGFSTGDSYDTVFGVTSSFGSGFTMLDAASQGGGGENALGIHAVAALLNTQDDDVNYPFTTAEVIDLVQGAYSSGDFEDTKNILMEENEQICPLN